MEWNVISLYLKVAKQMMTTIKADFTKMAKQDTHLYSSSIHYTLFCV